MAVCRIVERQKYPIIDLARDRDTVRTPPFIEFIDVDETRAGSTVSWRGSDRGVSTCRPVLGGKPIETDREHGDEREAQPD